MEESVLFVDDEEHLRIAAEQTFELAGISCRCFSSAEEALTHLTPDAPSVLVTDIRMPDIGGVELLQRALEADAGIPVIMVTGHGDVDLAVNCIKQGAYDFLEKPCEPARLVASVQRAIERRNLTLENRALKQQVASTDIIQARLLGRSAPMVALRDTIREVAATDADVLITGETGTGKEIAARAIHQASERANGPFVQVNCAALPANLIESELFGAEAGAFPGATRARFGRLEHARGGVLCLDEIDSLPLALQAKLLDVLHNRQVTRLGSNDAIPLDIRVIAISKTDLTEAVAEGRFRPDLLYRLNVVTLRMPGIDERREDVPSLFTALVSEAASRYEVETPDVSADVLSDLASRDWPGHVRELRNAAERFVLGLSDPRKPDCPAGLTLAEQMASHEKAILSAAIAANGGRLKQTYETLGLSRKTLYDKMQKHGLSRGDFAEDS